MAADFSGASPSTSATSCIPTTSRPTKSSPSGRDFFDVHALLQIYGSSRLLEPAAEKDAGFTADTFLDALNAIKRLTPQDWAEDGIDANAVDDLRSTFAGWHRALVTTEAD
jgi:hypothetical protein